MDIKVLVKPALPETLATPALIVLLSKEDKPGLESRPELAGLQEMISPRLKAGDFEADHLAVLSLFPPDGPMKRLILVGLGEAEKCGPARLRAAAAQGVRTAQKMGATSAALCLPPACKGVSADQIGQICALGACLGAYDYMGLKKEKGKSGRLGQVTLLGGGADKALKDAARRGQVIAQGVALARDLSNRPANLLYPESLADEALQMAREAGLEAEVITQEMARDRGMGAFLAVAQGSQRPGRIIILRYQGAAKSKRPLCLVGKAITFDSGGISLKPVEGMGAMKMDMSGGAVVLGVMKAAAGLKLKENLVGIVAAAENMPSGSSYRPGDVITSLSGQTIEIVSTDAEGRMVLADALTLCGEYKPRAVVDLATLTGACMVALGLKCAGLMVNDEGLRAGLQAASAASGEMIWELPLIEEYNELLKSPVADMRNSGKRWAGAIYAGLFLQKYAPPKVPWAHLDIAGPAIAEQASPDIPEGGSGFGVQLLMQWLGA